MPDFHHVNKFMLDKPETVQSFPFGEDVYVYKVKNKMFATLSIGKINSDNDEQHWWLNLKCDPDEAFILRDIFPSIIPGYHMNKKLWNTVILDCSIPQGEIERMIDNSFMLVVNKMTKKDQKSILMHR